MPAANDHKEEIGTFHYAIALLSFIPLLGVPIALVVMVYGLASGKRGAKRLALIGAGGIAITVILYGSLFYFVFFQKSGAYDGLRAEMVQGTLAELVKDIEYYKLQNGKYPESLETLQKTFSKQAAANMNVYDMSDMTFRPGHQLHMFYYQLADKNHYYLLSVGPDGQPFTDDDIVPALDANAKVGLLIKQNRPPAKNNKEGP